MPPTDQPTIVLVDSARFVEASAAVVATAPSAAPIAALPFYLADAADPGLPAVGNLPGIIGVVAGDKLILSMLEGLNRVALLCFGLVEDWLVGGVAPGQPYPYVFDQPQGQLAPSAVCAAVNLSLTPPNDAFAPTLPTDVVNHATRSLAELTLPVVAAGNHRERGLPFETVSPWAEPNWVLSVGATTDESGESEWPHSGRGSTANPQVGPDVLTWGQDALSDDGFGTSFAAARMSQMATLCRAWLFQVAANIDRLAGRPFGVPEVGVAIVDRELATIPPSADELAALPVLEAAPGALEQRALDGFAAALKGWEAVGATRRLLLAAAAMPPTDVPLSAPSLTPKRLKQFLDSVSLARLFELVAAAAPPSMAPSDTPLFPAGTADELWLLIWDSQPAWGWDIDTRTPRLRHH